MAENPDWKIKKKPGWGPKFWKRWILNGYLDRPLESVRDRYKRFVRNLTVHDLEMIFRWVDKHRTAIAYLHFTGPNNRCRGDRLFSHVSKDDPMTTKK